MNKEMVELIMKIADNFIAYNDLQETIQGEMFLNKLEKSFNSDKTLLKFLTYAIRNQIQYQWENEFAFTEQEIEKYEQDKKAEAEKID